MVCILRLGILRLAQVRLKLYWSTFNPFIALSFIADSPAMLRKIYNAVKHKFTPSSSDEGTLPQGDRPAGSVRISWTQDGLVSITHDGEL